MLIGSDDLSTFFDDFAEECELPGGSKVKVILDSSDSETLNGRIISSEFIMMGKSSELNFLKKSDLVIISGQQYQVHKVMIKDDGKICEVFMSEKS